MKTVSVQSYTEIDGVHYFGDTHIVTNEIAAKLIARGAIELTPETEKPEGDKPKPAKESTKAGKE